LVVQLSLLRVGEDLVGVGNFLELLFGIGVVCVLVYSGMVSNAGPSSGFQGCGGTYQGGTSEHWSCKPSSAPAQWLWERPERLSVI
jgi:hypothetical protein